ncbi:hypothetical protein M758_UG304600 [Ceratodon purpureus]|nr:hypothetical protein M758_UG304600 [Ceratodon purpureus]
MLNHPPSRRPTLRRHHEGCSRCTVLTFTSSRKLSAPNLAADCSNSGCRPRHCSSLLSTRLPQPISTAIQIRALNPPSYPNLNGQTQTSRIICESSEPTRSHTPKSRQSFLHNTSNSHHSTPLHSVSTKTITNDPTRHPQFHPQAQNDHDSTRKTYKVTHHSQNTTLHSNTPNERAATQPVHHHHHHQNHHHHHHQNHHHRRQRRKTWCTESDATPTKRRLPQSRHRRTHRCRRGHGHRWSIPKPCKTPVRGAQSGRVRENEAALGRRGGSAGMAHLVVVQRRLCREGCAVKVVVQWWYWRSEEGSLDPAPLLEPGSNWGANGNDLRLRAWPRGYGIGCSRASASARRICALSVLWSPPSFSQILSLRLFLPYSIMPFMAIPSHGHPMSLTTNVRERARLTAPAFKGLTTLRQFG